MKILLVKPFNVSDHIQPSIGLGYLATAVCNDNEVKILDCIKEHITIEKLPQVLRAFNPDILGLQCYTFDVRFVKEAFSAARKARNDVITVIGGPHPSAAPDETFAEMRNELDFLFVGEAEVGFPQLVRSLQRKERKFDGIPGLVWREGQMLRKNPRCVVDDLDRLGLPAWDLIHPETYPQAQHGAFFKKFPIAPIMITRGCPFSCTFCAAEVVSGKKVRKRSVQSVLKEITILYNDFGIREFHIVDDNFTMNRTFAKDFLRGLKALRLDISWAVPNGVRMDTLDEEMLSLMKETGLYLISLGIESGSDRILRLMKKSITTEKIIRYVKMIRHAGIDVAGFFILGFPGETAASIWKTIRFSLRLDLSRANFFTYLPFPGTESFRRIQAEGELNEMDWEHFYFTNASYAPKGFSRGQLKRLQRLAFFFFYFRPRIMFYQIKNIQSPRHLMFLTKRFFRWIVTG